MSSPNERLSVVASRLSALLLAAVIVGAGACYRPNIVDGGLFCSSPEQLCPDGFVCSGGRCHKKLADGAVSEVKAETNTDTRPPDAGSDACTPSSGIAGCVVQSGLACDPVCQTVCCGGQKCTAMNTGPSPGGAATLGCAAVNTPIRRLGDPCDPKDAGTERRSDNCAAGLACIEGNNGSMCLKLCRGDADCDPGIKCEQRGIEAGTGSYVASVCGLPHTPCDPTLGPISGCPSSRICYLVTSDRLNGDTTICEISSGENKNLSCKYSRECLIGYTCAATGPGAGYCRPTCSHAMVPICPPGLACQNFGKTYDYCF